MHSGEGISISRSKAEDLPLLQNNQEQSLVNQEQNFFIAYMKDIIKLDSKDSYAALVLEESNYRRIVRKSANVGGILLGSTAGLPYINIAMEAGKNKQPLGYLSAGGVVIAYGAATIWVMHTLTSKLSPTARIEGQITISEVLPTYRHWLCVTLGIVTSFSTIYVMTRYPYTLLLLALAYVTDFGYKTQGYYTAFEYFRNLIMNGFSHEKERIIDIDNLTQQDYALIIKEIIIPLLLQNYDEIKKLFIWNDQKTDQENIQDFFNKIIVYARESPMIEALNNSSKDIKKNSQISSLLIPVCNLLTSFYFNTKTASIVVNHPAFAYPAAALLTIPHFALDILGTTGAAGEVVDSVRGRYRGSLHNSRGLNIGMIFMCCALAAFSAYVDGFIVEDNLSKDDVAFYRKMSIFLALILFLANTMFEGFTSRITYNNMISKAAQLTSNETIKTKALVVEKLSRLSSSIGSLKSGLFYWSTKNPTTLLIEGNTQTSQDEEKKEDEYNSGNSGNMASLEMKRI